MVGGNFASLCSSGAHTTLLKVSLSDSGLVWALPTSVIRHVPAKSPKIWHTPIQSPKILPVFLVLMTQS